MAAIVPPQAQQLDLAHVLCLDLAGSSSPPALQDRAALQNLQEVVQRTSEFGRARAMNQISVAPSGDGMAFVFIGDPEAPLRCAVEISRKIPSAARARLRMGLHSWPVGRIAELKSDGAATEKGIDFAHRVMDCGDQGHILVSESVVDLLRQRGHWNDALHDLGEIEVNQGVRLRLFNFWNSEAGNPALPNKLFRLNSVKNLDIANKPDRSEGGI